MNIGSVSEARHSGSSLFCSLILERRESKIVNGTEESGVGIHSNLRVLVVYRQRRSREILSMKEQKRKMKG